MPKLTINGKEIEVESGLTLIQACEIAGVEVPRFCYHDRLQVAGNCRMCLVEVEKSPKPVASCAMPITEGMVVHTDSPMVKRARENVLEFLLINHPLDCPICDEGGECDLQDQAYKYGKGTNRFSENKRAVKDKYMGPLIQTKMNRCIHCTRCVRFITDVAGVPELGAFGRGEHMEVSTFIEKALSSELSGNIIDLCPVGALTAKPHAFKARSWELRKTESIDVHDAIGSNIRVDSKGNAVIRILPLLNESINEEWISDKARFACDGLMNQRLDVPMVRVDGKLQAVSWEMAYKTIAANAKKLQPEQIAALAGEMADAESMMVLKDVMQAIGTPHFDSRPAGVYFDTTHRSNYLFNTTIEGIDNSDLCILIATNPRTEATVLNARIRKRWLAGGYKIYSLGQDNDLTYPTNHLGDSLVVLEEILSGEHPIGKDLESAKRPMLIIGYGALKRDDSKAVLHLCNEICKKYNFISNDWNGFNILHQNAAQVAALDLGFVPHNNGYNTAQILQKANLGDIKMLYLLGVDEVNESKFDKCFIVYQGHHGDRAAHMADVILPGLAYTEKNATYVNLEGRLQRTQQAVGPCGQARPDWEVIWSLAQHLHIKLAYNNLKELRLLMAKTYPIFATYNQILKQDWQNEIGRAGKIHDTPLMNKQLDYYLANPICRASKTMAQCVSEIVNQDRVE